MPSSITDRTFTTRGSVLVVASRTDPSRDVHPIYEAQVIHDFMLYYGIFKAEMSEIPLAQSNIQLSIEDISMAHVRYIVQCKKKKRIMKKGK